jgi:Protein of unknown function (DUF3501)
MDTTTPRKLQLDDIADLRAYEREREEFRAHIIALKKVRRNGVGPHVTLVFENRDTIRFQIQEMARAEKILSDEGIQTELDIYNKVIPEPGTLSATLFIELVSDEELREWLPKLVGIERSVVLRFGGFEVRCRPEADHEAQLTRDEITASVHYVFFELTPEQVAAWGTGPVELAVDHPAYQFSTTLREEVVSELRSDLVD